MADETEGKRILVLVDRLVPNSAAVRTSHDPSNSPPTDRTRLSLWSNVLRSGSYEEISISDEKHHDPPEAVRIDSYQRVFINWDAANGDYVCGSDDVLSYFQTRTDRRAALLRNGGILCCEFQSGKGVLHQGAYDALFGVGEVQVVEADAGPERTNGATSHQKDGEKWNYTAVKRIKRYWWHPITKGLEKTFASRHFGDAHLFPFTSRPSGGDDFYWNKYQQSIYNGWFNTWKKDWVPLLIAVRRPGFEPSIWKRLVTPPPVVLLAKCHSNGVVLASTLWIAGSKWAELVKQIVEADVVRINRLHRRLRWFRRVYDAVWLFFIVFVCLPKVIEWLGRMHPWEWLTMTVPYLAQVPLLTRFIERIGNVWEQIGPISVLLVVYGLWHHFILRRPYGILFPQFIGHGWSTFRETF